MPRLGNVSLVVMHQLLWCLAVTSHVLCPGSEVFANWVNGVSTGLDHHVGDRRLRVGFLGRLTPAEGIPYSVRGVRHPQQDEDYLRLHHRWRAVFASERGRAEVETALARVAPFSTRLGWTTPDHLFSNIDILVVPSAGAEESFGLVVC